MSEHSLAGEGAHLVLRAEHFEPFVGRDVLFEEPGITLLLASVDRLRGAAADTASRAPFLLIFTGPKRPSYLAEKLYRCDFGKDCVFEIHVAPIHTSAADRQDYQAVFD